MTVQVEKLYFEIQQLRAYSVDSLVGNLGGYMGLFLGYALLNFPTLFLELCHSMKKIIISWSSLTLDTPDNEELEVGSKDIEAH